MARKKQVEIIVFRKKNNNYEFLLLKRIPEKGGFWQPPCGGIEEGEDIIDAAFREILEETGIKREDVIRIIKDVHYFEVTKHYLTGKPIQPLHEYVLAFEVKPNTNVRLDNNIYVEHEKYGWFPFDKALKMLKWQDNKDGFIKLGEILGLI